MASKNYVFYKICSDNCNDIYVGSTANFKSRKNHHKSSCYNETDKRYNYKIYQAIRANGGWDNFKMIQIGTRDNITKREAEQIEEEYRLDLKATMNRHRAFASKEVVMEDRKKYYQDNKDTLDNKNRIYYENNKEKIDKWQKQYAEDNIETLTEYRKNYYENKKEKIKEKHREVIDCECGLTYTYGHKSRHLKSKRHCEYIK